MSAGEELAIVTSLRGKPSTIFKKIKKNIHKTLSPASVDKSVHKIIQPWKYHAILDRKHVFA